MQSVSDDDVQKRLLERPRFELVAKGVFRLGRCYMVFRFCLGLWQDISSFHGLWASIINGVFSVALSNKVTARSTIGCQTISSG